MQIRKEFSSTPLNPSGDHVVESVATIFSDCLNKLESISVDGKQVLGGRAMALVITKLQEAKMWAVRGVAENTEMHAAGSR